MGSTDRSCCVASPTQMKAVGVRAQAATEELRRGWCMPSLLPGIPLGLWTLTATLGPQGPFPDSAWHSRVGQVMAQASSHPVGQGQGAGGGHGDPTFHR